MHTKDLQLLRNIYEHFDGIADGAPDASYAAREALNFCAPLKNLIDSTQSGDSAGYHIDQALSMTYDDVARAQVSALISIAISLNRSQSQ
jgi:hypothetical protein